MIDMQQIDVPAEVRATIARNALLALIEPVQQECLIERARLQRFAKGETIYDDGEPAMHVWMVARGQVKVAKFTERGHALMLELMIPAEIFGAIFYAPDPFYPASAIALEESLVLTFRVEDLLHCLEQSVALQKATLADTCRRLCHAQNMRGLSQENVARRIGYALIYLSGKFGPVIPHSRNTLAELAGTTVETAIRVTRDLSKKGILTTGRGSMTVCSVAELQKIVHGQAGQIA